MSNSKLLNVKSSTSRIICQTTFFLFFLILTYKKSKNLNLKTWIGFESLSYEDFIFIVFYYILLPIGLFKLVEKNYSFLTNFMSLVI